VAAVVPAVAGIHGLAALAAAGAAETLRFTAGFPIATAIFSIAMFDLVKPQIATAADKLTHLRRFL
jgi:hydrogenase/urease accessory protein HupE